MSEFVERANGTATKRHQEREPPKKLDSLE